jgi:transposase
MRFYAGIDLHANNNVLAVLNDSGQLVCQRRLSNVVAVVIGELERFQSALVGVVVESTFNWYWLVDGLQAAGYQVHLANTTAIQPYQGIKYTNDLTDARWLAEMLRQKILPEGRICPAALRAWRDLGRRRMQLVQQRTSQIVFLQMLLARVQGHRPSRTRVREVDVKTLGQPRAVGLNVASGLRIIDALDSEIARIEKVLLAQVALEPSFQQLQTVWGIGKILASVMALEIWDIHRFKTPGDLASYARCVSSSRFSNGKRKGQNNVRNGNPYLAWALIEAAHFAAMHYPPAQAFVARKTEQCNRALAIKALANKLARACFFVLRDQVDFDPKRVFGS